MAKWSVLLLVFCTTVFFSCKKTDYTFNNDIAPIIIENCVPCHRDQGAAPFSLTNYQQVNRKRNTIVKVTQRAYMPPWPANRHYSSFVGEKYLTAEEKAMIKNWVKGGAPEGDGVMPEIPPYSPYSRIGQPDTTIWFDSVFISGNNRDQFYIMTLPFELKEKTFVRAMEFIPNENKLVHHMNGHLLNYEDYAKSDVYGGLRIMNIEVDEKTYLKNFDSMALYNDDGSKPARIHSAVNYLPGVEASIYPEGIGGFTVNKKAILVANDMHYAPIPKGKWDYSHVNLFFAKQPPKRPVKETMMGTNGISKIIPPLVVPANEITTHVSSIEVDQDISILTINPHMHLLGQSFKAYAIKPNLDTIRLIHIPRWDFRWQYFYTFPKMLKIPAGSTITIEASFDNTSNNPNNPNDPPEEVAERLDRGGEGMRTTDEMLQFIITWLPYEEGDEEISLDPSDL
ncbi:MAG: hypothetical protein JXR19_09590 [Bacteroidia bacterium]